MSMARGAAALLLSLIAAEQVYLADGFQLAPLPFGKRSQKTSIVLRTGAGRNSIVSLKAEVPQWAQKFETGKVISTITLSQSKKEIAVKVGNEEMSWEKWHAALVGEAGEPNAAAMAVKVSPASGEMAPRGKEAQRIRTEASDPEENYKDFALVGLELTREGLGYLTHVKEGGKDELSEKPLFLVIKTEQSSHTYQVKLDASG
eukprot:CAMPEP_0173091150 /NCGR_PEP_ID=MMETSP1102-20130122/27639_1 /TAXON_ID=49646 /ORGANISM="Geminigera sp., Strain Caron Lab Isolate" /LENGTH=202 /DNA_ID=CAMNT_0013976751 /DNA_START=21 /DNA_END=629 /DNA_ORIENTATION=-